MRYVRVENLKEGMILAKSLRTGTCYFLLTEGTVLKAEYINKISELGFAGVYIKDEISKGIEVEEPISEEQKQKVLKYTEKFFNNINTSISSQISLYSDITSAIRDIVDTLFSNPHIMFSMNTLKSYDNYTYYHSLNVAIISMLVGISFEMNKKRLTALGMAALLHDIGKEFLPIDVLNKPGKLTDEEFEIIKTHPQRGYDYIKNKFTYSGRITLGILHHHEKYNGTGYPKGLKKNEINIYSKIISIADVYDALTSKRPYHKPMSSSAAMEYIMSNSGVHFDPDVVEHFVQHVSVYPVGTEVELSNGRCAIVVKNYEGFALRPLVRYIDTMEEIDLRDDMGNLNITIIKAI